MQWQNGFLCVSKVAAPGWAEALPGAANTAPHHAICPNGMRSFWKVAAFRLTGSIRIQSGTRALPCFQNELLHFVISNLEWYKLP